MCLRLRLAFLVVLAATILQCFGCSAARPVTPQPPPAPAALASTSSASAPPTDAEASPTSRPEQALAKVPLSAADPQWGSVDAPVTIVEFSDFQCPFCSRVMPTLEHLKGKYGPKQLRIVFKHNPLPFHQQARPAAEAAAAVFMLAGSAAFFEFHDRAFGNQQSLSPETYESWAESIGVQAQALRAWLESGRAGQKVAEDMALARTLGANGTPAFRINGVTLSGAQPVQKFIEVIDEQLEAAKQLTLSGTPPRLVYVTLTDKNTLATPPPAPPRAADPDENDTEVWNLPIAADDPQLGSRDALVTIVEFSDYQCPFCKRVEPTLEEVRRLYGGDLRIVWKDNPLPFHPRALPAAKLARHVYQTRGDDAFWKFHDALFASNPKLEDGDFEAIALKLGLPWKPLRDVLDSDKQNARISESAEQANDFMARGTPHFFVNGRRLSGAQPVERFKRLIDEELLKARALVQSGTPRAKLYTELTRLGKNPPAPDTKHVALRAGAASRGNPKAPVVLQLFSDFQCPFCRRVEPTLKEIETEFKGSIRIVWRHLPLPFHKYAEAAAEASEEVLAQKGATAFWQYHDQLFEAQAQEGGLERAHLEELARQLGLDMLRFTAALDNHIHLAKVKGDAEAANKVDINGTPAVLVNDYVVSGAQPTAAFRKLIRLALKRRPKP